MARHAADFIESLRRKAVSIHTITNYERDLRHFAEFLNLRKSTIESTDHVTAARLSESSLYGKAPLEEFGIAQTRMPEDIFQVHGSGRTFAGKSCRTDLFAAAAEKTSSVSGRGRDQQRRWKCRRATDCRRFGIARSWSCFMRADCASANSSGLNEDEIDMQQETVRVLGKGNKERIVPFGSFAARAIQEYLKAKHSLGNDEAG